MINRLFAGWIEELDEDQRMVFGWAYVAVTKTGDQVTDHSGDEVDPANLEDVAYDYVLHSREGGEMHADTHTRSPNVVGPFSRPSPFAPSRAAP
jgi:hypothetical protein